MRCLGFLAGTNCPHYDSEPARRPTLRRLVARGTVPAALAADDGVGLHYVGDRLARIVSSRPRAKAYRVRELRGRAVETRLPTKYLGARNSMK
jgi:dipeptidase E